MTAAEPPAERRAGRWAAAIVVVTVLASVGLPLLGMRVFHASDVLGLFAPWRDEAPQQIARATNGQVTDTVDALVPLRAEYRRRVHDGDYPLWTSYPSGGTELGSVPDVGPLDPIGLPYLVGPVWYAPGATKLLELAVAVGFTFLFLRRLRLGRPAALAGGLVFAFSGFQVVWTNWPQTHVGALIPALFWAVERAIDRGTARAAVPVALATAAMLFGGFPAVAAYGLLAAGAYAVVRVASGGDRRGTAALGALARVGAAVALGVGIAAFQLVPFLHQIRSDELAFRDSLRGQHLPLRAIATLAVPDAFGSPVDGVYYGDPNYVELQSFIGVAALLLAAVALLRPDRGPLPRGVRPYLWAGAAIAAWLIFVGGPPLSIFQRIPMLGTNHIGRLRSVMGFLLAALAAVGLQALAAGPRERAPGERRAWWRLAVLGAAGLAGAYGLARGWQLAGEFAHRGYVLKQAALPAASGVAGLAALALGRRRRAGGAPLAVWIFPVLIAAEALAFAGPFWPRVPRDQFYPRTAVHGFLAANLGHDRFASESRTMYGGTATFYGLRSVTAHVFLARTWSDLIAAVDPTAFSKSRRVPFLQPGSATSPVLDRLAARYFVTAPEVPVPGRRLAAGDVDGTVPLARSATLAAPLPPGAAAGEVRAVVAELAEQYRLSGVAWLRAEVLDASGRVLARGARRVRTGQKEGELQVAVAAEPGAAGRAASVRLALEAPSGGLSLTAGAGGRPLAGAVLAADDGLRVAHAGSAIVYERTRALPRIRWAGRAQTIADRRQRIETLKRGADPATVILSARGPAGSGAPGTVEVLGDDGDEIRVRIRAQGAGYLVVADALQDGWRATLDGKRAPLRDADHAFVAVRVPAGEHEVVLGYRPAGWRRGLAISGASLLILALAVTFRRRRSPPEGA